MYIEIYWEEAYLFTHLFFLNAVHFVLTVNLMLLLKLFCFKFKPFFYVSAYVFISFVTSLISIDHDTTLDNDISKKDLRGVSKFIYNVEDVKFWILIDDKKLQRGARGIRLLLK